MRLTWSINTSNPENCHSPPVLSPFREKDKAHCPASIGLFLAAFDRMRLIIKSVKLQIGRQNGKEVLNVKSQAQDESGMIRIFCRYIVKNGKRIYPKRTRFFTFLVDSKKVA